MVDSIASASVLVLGGCGFTGRHLVSLLVDQGCQRIRVVDKPMPAMAFLSPTHSAAFASPAVEYRQADLTRQQGLEKAFDGGGFQVVFNLTFDAVTYGQTDEVYQQMVVDLTAKVAAMAAQSGVVRFVDLSTAQVYDPSEKAATEAAGKLKPWTKQAAFKLRAEGALRESGSAQMSMVVLRPATMYGPADVHGLSPRVLCAAVYRHLGEKMKFAWDAKLRANTVHVHDVALACVHVAMLRAPAPAYNLADKSDSSQGSLAAALEEIFNIKTGFAGTMASTAMKAVGLKRVAEDYNDKHMAGWQELCKAAGIGCTHLTPHIDAELLSHNHLACDGSLIESTGFTYAYPQLTAASLREQVDAYIAQGLFPPLG